MSFDQKSFHMPVRKRRQKGLKVSEIALLLVVFKWHRGSEGVNLCMISMWLTLSNYPLDYPNASAPKVKRRWSPLTLNRYNYIYVYIVLTAAGASLSPRTCHACWSWNVARPRRSLTEWLGSSMSINPKPAVKGMPLLTPSLSQPVKFPSWKVQQTVYAYKQCMPTNNVPTNSVFDGTVRCSWEGGKRAAMVSNLAILRFDFRVTAR